MKKVKNRRAAKAIFFVLLNELFEKYNIHAAATDPIIIGTSHKREYSKVKSVINRK